MKIQICHTIPILLASISLLALTLSPVRADTVLLDPEQPLNYPIEAWTPLNTAQTIRLEVISFEAPANGGGGLFLQSPLDLSSDKYFVAKIKIRNGNTAESVRLVLVSSDKGSSEWSMAIPATAKAGDWLVFAGRLAGGKLAHGVTKPVDLKAVAQVQFVGSFNNKHRVAVDVEVIKTTNTAPEDALAAR